MSGMTDEQWAEFRRWHTGAEECDQANAEIDRLRAVEAELREENRKLERYLEDSAVAKVEAITREGHLRAELAAWRDAMPPCRHNDLGCGRKATRCPVGMRDHYLLRCDEHQSSDYVDLPYAPLLRSANSAKGEK